MFIIDRFQKSQRKEIIVAICKHGENLYADIRCWITDSKGTEIPTKKGIQLRVDLLPELIDAIQKLKTEAARLPEVLASIETLEPEAERLADGRVG